MIFIRKPLEFLLLLIIVTTLSYMMHKERESSSVYVHLGQRTNQSEINSVSRKNQNNGIINYTIQSIGSFFTLSWGNNTFGRPLYRTIKEAFFITLKISLAASILSLVTGITIGIAASENLFLQRLIENTMNIFLSVPIFIFALFLLWIFSGYWRILPPGGVSSSYWMVLPVFAVSSKSIARIALFTMDFTIEQRKKGYFKTHRAFGLKKKRLLFIFQLKNSAAPILALWLVDFAGYISGSAIIESIYSIPGLGYLILKSVLTYDIHTLTILMFVIATMVYMISSLQWILNNTFMKYEQ